MKKEKERKKYLLNSPMQNQFCFLPWHRKKQEKTRERRKAMEETFSLRRCNSRRFKIPGVCFICHKISSLIVETIWQNIGKKTKSVFSFTSA